MLSDVSFSENVIHNIMGQFHLPYTFLWLIFEGFADELFLIYLEYPQKSPFNALSCRLLILLFNVLLWNIHTNRNKKLLLTC